MATLPFPLRALPGAVPAALARVDAAQWVDGALAVHQAGGRLAALWGADNRDQDGTFAILAAFAVPEGLAVLALPLPEGRPAYADLSGLFPAASRMQRATHDLLGLVPEGAEDLRPWLRHAAWRADEFPLRRDFGARHEAPAAEAAYPFVRVEGDGVHEIPVGPIHAGIIEPGHFRFSVVGEKVLRLEERLGYAHKGIDRRFEDFEVADGYRLAGRVSGDSTVAYAWAYAQAAEAAAQTVPPPRARWLRALLLECERVANHLGDLGALGNDAALGFALAQFWRVREDWLRLAGALFGHRLMMDRIVPGGVDCRPRRARGARAARALRGHARRGAHAQPHPRGACRAAGPLHHHRSRDPGSGRDARPHGARRAGERPGARPARGLPLHALRRARGEQGRVRRAATWPPGCTCGSTS